ncbi:baseplate J/gp47 family protein [uncultured Erythrobacter sp.]|uniref:baseplate J/gp47 family protein n=1 Tax=uncultured Erythrobacter sp. TaxID=263913 RepID=UPI002626AB6A|nr:baseplate J/gp47 family protein [uncultured Erythrobacter sp.]
MARILDKPRKRSRRALHHEHRLDAVPTSLWALVTDMPSDVSRALLSTWYTLKHVLEFYGQRIDEEGSIDSARESNSVRWLAEMGGLRPRPAECAQTLLALTLDDTGKRATSINLSGEGDICVQNAPQHGETAAIFESAQAIALNSDWNRMALQTRSARGLPVLVHGSTGLSFGSGTAQWRKGDGLMLHLKSLESGSLRQEFVTVDGIESLIGRGETIITWADCLKLVDGPNGTPSADTFLVEKVEHFGQPSALFGKSAAAWDSLPAQEKAVKGLVAGGLLQLNGKASGYWQNAAFGLPRSDATCVLQLRSGVILLGTSKGLYRREPEGKWEKTRLPAGEHDVTVLSDHEEVVTTSTSSHVKVTSVGAGIAKAALAGLGGLLGGLISWALPKPKISVTTTKTTTITRSVDTGLVYAGTKAGKVLVSADLGVSWSELSSKNGAAGTPINALLVALDETNSNRMLVAATSQGLKSFNFAEDKWKVAAPDQANGQAVNAMVPFLDELVIATDFGLFKVTDIFEEQIGFELISDKHLSCTSLEVSDDKKTLFIGTQSGVWKTADLTLLDEFSTGFDGTQGPVFSLCCHGTTLHAATGRGVFKSPLSAANWTKASAQVVPLFDAPQGFADDLKSKGQVGPDLSRAFALAGLTMPSDTKPQHLPKPPDGAIDAWTVSNDDQQYLVVRRSQQLVVGLLTPIPFANAMASCGTSLLAATRESGPLNREWPGFGQPADMITLERRATGIKPQSTVLVSGEGLEQPRRAAVIKVETLLHKAFGKSSNVTQLTLGKKDEQLALASRRNALLYPLKGEVAPLGASRPHGPFSGKAVALKSAPPSLNLGRQVLVQGKRRALAAIAPIPTKATAKAGKLDKIFVKHNQLKPSQFMAELDCGVIGKHAKPALKSIGIVAGPSTSAVVIKPSVSWLIRQQARDKDAVWQILVFGCDVYLAPLPLYECLEIKSDGSPKTIRAANGKPTLFPDGFRHIWQYPAHWQVEACERAIVASHDADALTFQERVCTPFDPASTRINANVVSAVAQQTIGVELLGSQARKRGALSEFTLSHGPLAYEIAGEGARPLIDIYVNPPAKAFSTQDIELVQQGSRWTPVEGLACASSNARVFKPIATGKSYTDLLFGDGVNGARLPDGDAHIAASYKIGGGESGNVAAGAIKAMRRKPLGITRVTNPFAAHGGRDAEATEELRRRTSRARCLSRQIVTLEDYAGFAQGFERVARAEAVSLSATKTTPATICVAIVWRDSPTETESDRRLADMSNAMMLNRVDALELKVVASRTHEAVLSVQITPQQTANPALLQKAVKEALFERFGKGAWPIGKDMPLSAIAHCIDSVPGIAGRAISHFAGCVVDHDFTSTGTVLEFITADKIWIDSFDTICAPGNVCFLNNESISVTIS